MRIALKSLVMHICRLIRKRCNSKSWKKVKNFLYFAKRRNFESITNSPEWSATTSSKGKQAKKLDDFLRRLKCVLNLWKSLWHAFLLLLWKLFNLHSFFFETSSFALNKTLTTEFASQKSFKKVSQGKWRRTRE